MGVLLKTLNEFKVQGNRSVFHAVSLIMYKIDWAAGNSVRSLESIF